MFLLIFRKIIFKSAWTFGSFQFAWIYFFDKYSSWLSQIFWYLGMKMLSKNLVGFYLSIVYLSILYLWGHKLVDLFAWAVFTWAFFTWAFLLVWIFGMGIIYLSILYLWAFLLVDLVPGQCLLEGWCMSGDFTCVNCVKFTCVTCVYCTSVPKLVWMVICAQEGFTFSWVQLFLWIGLPSV